MQSKPADAGTPFPGLRAAVSYAELGWYPFPVEARGKRPIASGGFLDATRDSNKLQEWWSAYPDANIGISLDPSGLVVLDIDVTGGKPGTESLAAFEAEFGPLPKTLMAKTGGGGWHALYRAPTGQKIGRRIGFRPGLDLLVNGYILVAPSIHSSGNAYHWIDQTVPIAELPESLIRIGTEKPTPTLSSAGEPGLIPHGQRNNVLFALASAMHQKGLGREALLAALSAENRSRCRPPLPDYEVQAIAESAMRYESKQDLVALARFSEALGLEDANPESQPERPLYELASDIAILEPQEMRYYATGLPDLDSLIGGGLLTRRFTALLGPPGAGKSALTIGIALHIETAALPVLYVSTELEGDEIIARIAAPLLNCSWRDIIFGRVPRARVHEVLAGRRFAILDCNLLSRDGGQALEQIAKAAEQLTAQYEIPPLIVVDYIQDLARGDNEGLRTRIGNIAVDMRVLAQQLDCAVFGVCSIGRQGYGNNLQAYRSGDAAGAYLNLAKESGDIDYAAATILHIDVLEGQDEWRMGRIAVAKSRLGRTGFVGVRFNGAIGKFEPCPEAVQAVMDTGRGGKSKEKEAESIRALVIGKIESMGNMRASKTRLAKSCGKQYSATLEVIDALLQEGVLEIQKFKYIDPFTHTVKGDEGIGIKGKPPNLLEPG